MSALFTLVIIAAVIATALKRRRVNRLRAAAVHRPGASQEQAIPIRSFADIDHHLRDHWCPFCGGFLERRGEGTRTVGGRQLRIARLECQECERPDEVFFDTTELVH